MIDAGDWFAVAMLMMIVATVVVAWPRRRADGRRLSDLKKCQGLLLAAVGVPALYLTIFGYHLCHEGTSWMQCAVGCLCALVTVVLIGDRKLGRLWVATVLIGMVVMAIFYDELVHGHDWTGNPRRPDHYAIVTDSNLDQLKKHLTESQIPDELPAGWVDALPFWTDLTLSEQSHFSAIGRSEIVAVWHTRLTHLWRERLVCQGFWFPGGRLADSAMGISVRDRPAEAG